jgi:hypothetical protein
MFGFMVAENPAAATRASSGLDNESDAPSPLAGPSAVTAANPSAAMSATIIKPAADN